MTLFFWLIAIAFSPINGEVSDILEIDQLKEAGDISELDCYVLHNYESSEELQNINSIRNRTIELLPFDILVRRMRKEIGLLKITIHRANTNVALDETLRWQIWNLSQTTTILETMIGNPIDPSFYFIHELKEEAKKTLKNGLKAYQRLNKRIESVLKEEMHNPHVHDFIHLTQEGMIPYYAEQFERMLKVNEWNKNHKACGATARAVLYYFQEKYLTKEKFLQALQQPLLGFHELSQQLAHNKDAEFFLDGENLEKNVEQKDGYLYFVESNKIDHVFVIQQTPEGYYRIYQSYVGQYSLQAAIAQQYLQTEGSPYLTYEELQQHLTLLDTILKAEEFTPEIVHFHKQLFHIPPPKQLYKEFKWQKSHLRCMVLRYKYANPL